mmetsp:Transcript_24710/g.68930  ORF Transcript_24710/g.68930 Transcript_24710/m.68930 type:complete len:289 (-) Transcript_24710:256-1122(-)
MGTCCSIEDDAKRGLQLSPAAVAAAAAAAERRRTLYGEPEKEEVEAAAPPDVKEQAAAVRKKAETAKSIGVYSGDWHNEMRHGKGMFQFSNGDWYEGEWYENKANGEGSFFSKGMSTYVGGWEADLKTGAGVETYEDGTVYEGNFKQGYRHGKGKLRWSDGSTYEGEFRNNNQEGIGTFKWRSKHPHNSGFVTTRQYTGEWYDNQLHGNGRYDFPDGTAYEGQYNMGLKDGYGTFMSKSGNQVQCTWEDGKPTGAVVFKGRGYAIAPTWWQDGIMLSWALRSEQNTPR